MLGGQRRTLQGGWDARGQGDSEGTDSKCSAQQCLLKSLSLQWVDPALCPQEGSGDMPGQRGMPSGQGAVWRQQLQPQAQQPGMV